MGLCDRIRSMCSRNKGCDSGCDTGCAAPAASGCCN
jgi:hypothetical protein